MADSDLQGSRVSSHLDTNPGITPSPTHCRSRTLMRDLCLTYYSLLQEFLIGGVQMLVEKGLLNFFVANYF